MELIQTFSDGSILTFDTGAFDNWCVYLQPPNQTKYAPTDLHYFKRLQQLGEVHKHQKIYNDFVLFYTPTTGKIDPDVLNLIRHISNSYNNNALEVEILFTIIYAGMIAEENKKFAVLKKRITRLGMHQTLIDLLAPAIAANFSRGKNWRELDQICIAKGF
jgi:hypothetical protein